MQHNVRKRAFTLAEVLITLGIIGVVAALVMPSLIANYKDKVYDTARKKAWSTIGQAVRVITVNGGISGATDAQDFVENHLREQIKILKTCDNANLRSCGIETNTNAIKTLAGTSTTMPKQFHSLASGVDTEATPNTNSYGFVMSNGYSVNLFYNPKCMPDDTVSSWHYVQDRVCVNAIYDMNGLGRPNQVGKDIGFVTVIYPDESSVAYAPNVVKEDAAYSSDFNNAPQACTDQNPDYSVPNRDELLAMYMNMNILGMPSAHYWSASEASPELAWRQSFYYGGRGLNDKTTTVNVRCVRR
jgi:prepilin-type N-terminal cleavage/methylation domain-containing protein